MSSNVSNPLLLSEKTLNGAFNLFIVYFVQGIFMAFPNFAFFTSIWSVPFLREKKEYILISAVAMMDSCWGFGFITAAVGRIRMIVNDEANNLVTNLDCLLTPWNAFFLITEHMYGMTLAVVSLDRLLLVWDPLRYIGFGRNYAYGLLAATHLPYVAMIARLAFSLAVNELKKNKPSLCFTEWVYDTQAYFYFVYTQNMVFCSVSVLLYLGVLYKYKQNQIKILPTLVAANIKSEMKKQKRLTITLGFSCLFTFIFLILPTILKNILAFINGSNEFMAIFVPIIAVISSGNPIANFCLYIHRHKDIRTAVKCLLKCRKVTVGMLTQTTVIHPTPMQNKMTNARKEPEHDNRNVQAAAVIESV